MEKSRSFSSFHWIFSGFLVLFCASCFSLGCAKEQPKSTVKKRTRVGLMITPQGLNDLGFNDLAFSGLKSAEKKYNIEGIIIEPSTMKDPEASLRFFAGQKFDAIIAVGVAFFDAIKKVAKEYPKMRFFIIDASFDEGNIQGVSFREHEGSFLCGYIAAKVAKSGKIGFVGGLRNEIILRFLNGYKLGALFAASETQVLESFIAQDFSGFNREDLARDSAFALYDQGCDVIYHAAGASGLGVISAGVERKKFVIGVDMNQDSTAPGLVLTSMVKRVDRVVEDVARMVVENQDAKEIKRDYGLSDGGLDLTNFQFTKSILGDALIKEVELLKEKICRGEIKIRQADEKE